MGILSNKSNTSILLSKEGNSLYFYNYGIKQSLPLDERTLIVLDLNDKEDGDIQYPLQNLIDFRFGYAPFKDQINIRKFLHRANLINENDRVYLNYNGFKEEYMDMKIDDKAIPADAQNYLKMISDETGLTYLWEFILFGVENFECMCRFRPDQLNDIIKNVTNCPIADTSFIDIDEYTSDGEFTNEYREYSEDDNVVMSRKQYISLLSSIRDIEFELMNIENILSKCEPNEEVKHSK